MVVTRTIRASLERLSRAWSDPDEVMAGGDRRGSPRRCAGWTSAKEARRSWPCDPTRAGAGQLVDVSIDRADGTHRVRPRFRGRERKPSLAGGARASADDPDEVPHVVTFVAINGATTELTVRESGYPDEQIVEVSRTGMEQVLDKLTAMLSKG